MNKLKKLAIRIGEISDEITNLKSQREINLEKCAGSEDEEFNRPSVNSDNVPFENCLFNAYEWVKSDREEGLTSSFHDVIINYGCKNCIGAYKAKRKIRLLRQERGRLVWQYINHRKVIKERKLMKYITQVMQDKDVKHIVEVDGKNVEVIQGSKAVDYGNKKGEIIFFANGVYVSKDLYFRNETNSYNFIHLAQVVLAIELVRFVLDHLGSDKQ